jgi:hypothetical protein
VASDLGVGVGRRRYNGGIRFPGELLKGCQYRAPIGAARLGRPFRIAIQDASQLRMFRLLNNAQVVPAEAAGSDDCDTRF